MSAIFSQVNEFSMLCKRKGLNSRFIVIKKNYNIKKSEIKIDENFF